MHNHRGRPADFRGSVGSPYQTLDGSTPWGRSGSADGTASRRKTGGSSLLQEAAPSGDLLPCFPRCVNIKRESRRTASVTFFSIRRSPEPHRGFLKTKSGTTLARRPMRDPRTAPPRTPACRPGSLGPTASAVSPEMDTPGSPLWMNRRRRNDRRRLIAPRRGPFHGPVDRFYVEPGFDEH
jgi:hypothetical protein